MLMGVGLEDESNPERASPCTDRETEARPVESQAQNPPLQSQAPNPPLQTARNGSSFRVMGWVSPPKHWLTSAQRGAGTGPRSHSKSCGLLQHQEAFPVIPNVCGLTPSQERSGWGRGASSGAAEDTEHLSEELREALGSFRKVQCLWCPPPPPPQTPGQFIPLQEGKMLLFGQFTFLWGLLCTPRPCSHVPFCIICTPTPRLATVVSSQAASSVDMFVGGNQATT